MMYLFLNQQIVQQMLDLFLISYIYDYKNDK